MQHNPFLRMGRASVIIDGQFGSTGKGLISGYLLLKEGEVPDFAVTNAAPNAGHTCVVDGKAYVTNHLPMAVVLHKKPTAVLDAGAIIDPELLLEEMHKYDVDPNRVWIHPRAAVIEDRDVEYECTSTSGPARIASTQHGCGSAAARRVLREAKLAADHPLLKPMVREYDLNYWMKTTLAKVLIEVPQGIGLGLYSGKSYPHCTSREVSVMQALADAQIHPFFLYHTMLTLRTFPIRVGNLVVDGEQIGFSGPWWSDQLELSWDQIGVPSELTTVTKRVRRVATFSIKQYRHAVSLARPTHIFLNFCNYLKTTPAFTSFDHRLRTQYDQELFGGDAGNMPIYYGFGPSVEDVSLDMDTVIERMGWERKNG